MPSPDEQGRQFEEAFAELIERVLRDDLQYAEIHLRPQTPGPQLGMDLYAVWRDSHGELVRWAFECKSSGAPIRFDEVAAKLADIRMAAETVDVWCLVSARSHLSARAADLIAWTKQDPAARFEVEVLSPHHGDLKTLFACHPDLYLRVYGMAAPELEARQPILDNFAEWLARATTRSHKRDIPPGWSRVEPSWREELPNDMREAKRFLRGFDASPPWAAVVHGWAVDRDSSSAELLSRLERPQAGVECCVVVAAGGEGKSTLLRQVAWLLAENAAHYVLFADRWSGGDELHMPHDFIDSLGPGSTVHLVVDDVVKLQGVGGLLDRRADWTSLNTRVTLLLATRQHRWLSARLRGLLARATTDDLELDLVPLDVPEREMLVRRIAEYGMLQAFTLREALALVRDVERDRLPTGRAWLLPLIMQLTDREGRRFEDILASVLDELFREESLDSLRLLLAVALLHAAGHGLRQSVGERLTTPAGFVTAHAALIAELDRQLAPEADPAYAITSEDLYTHHQVIADALIEQAQARLPLRPALHTVARDLPRALVPATHEWRLIPYDQFVVLEAIADRLLEVEAFPVLEHFYQGWIALDTRQPPAWHRLGVCYSRWLAIEGARNPERRDLLDQLAIRGRNAFAESERTLRAVFSDPRHMPSVYRRHRFEDRLRAIDHAAGVLETRIFRFLGPRPAYLRALYFGITALSDEISSQDGRESNVLALVVLAHALLYNHQIEECATIVSTALAIDPEGHGLEPVLAQLHEEGCFPVPDRSRFVEAVESILCVLIGEWQELGIADDQETFRGLLRNPVERAAGWIEGSEHLASRL